MILITRANKMPNERWGKGAVLFFGSAVLLTSLSNSFACQPVNGNDSSREVVLKRYESVDTVVVATLVKTRKIKVKGQLNDFEMSGEQDTFRTVRVFKGSIKPGDDFVITTTLSGCGISAVNDPPWLFTANGKPARRLERNWLIYKNLNDNTQITRSPYTRMLGSAGEDLRILEKLTK
jgi:hypothetical protein